MDWLIVVFLFTPAINYHLARRTSVHLEALRDPQVAARLLEDYEQDLRDSDEITHARLKRRPLWEKIVGPFVWILERQQ